MKFELFIILLNLVCIFSSEKARLKRSPLDIYSGKQLEDSLCTSCEPNALHCSGLVDEIGVSGVQELTQLKLLGIYSHSGFFQTEKGMYLICRKYYTYIF